MWESCEKLIGIADLKDDMAFSMESLKVVMSLPIDVSTKDEPDELSGALKSHINDSVNEMYRHERRQFLLRD